MINNTILTDSFHGSYDKKAKAAKQFVRDRETELQGEIGTENAAIETHAEWQPESVTSRREEADLKRQKTVSNSLKMYNCVLGLVPRLRPFRRTFSGSPRA